jgi:hypothetical protein|tara:strand:+ start:388 stop:591 length:204 start_codon:yes stop_codon:yes gene_type:complete
MNVSGSSNSHVHSHGEGDVCESDNSGDEAKPAAKRDYKNVYQRLYAFKSPQNLTPAYIVKMIIHPDA